MMSHQITERAGAHKRRQRVGRGSSSGCGKTCGRGHKGAGARAGGGVRSTYEGGQMPIFRRLPKRGFNNKRFAVRFAVVNVADLQRFEDGATVDAAVLAESGLVRSRRLPIKILGNGQLSRRLKVVANKFSSTAVEKITAAGGSVEVLS